MIKQNMTSSALVYNGAEIRAMGERLNLTDMWNAAGSDPSKQPSNWRDLPATKEFSEHVAAILIPGKSGNELFHVVRGGRSPRTEAHWQIGLAYAKYLSPEFHIWCNTVVRERMEGKLVAADSDDLLRRTDGVARSTIHKVTGIEKAVEGIGTVIRLMSDSLASQDQRAEHLETAVLDLAERVQNLLLGTNPRIAVLDYVSVRELLNEAGAVSKGRNGVNRKVGRELKDRALLTRPPIPLRKCPHTGVWLYPRDFATVYMAERGKLLVSEHNAKAGGQGVLLFPKHRRRPAKPVEPTTDQPGA